MRAAGTGLTGTDLAGYARAQTAGAIAGSVLVNLMFDRAPVTFSSKDRTAAWPTPDNGSKPQQLPDPAARRLCAMT